MTHNLSWLRTWVSSFYRHQKGLPGRPDLYFPKYAAAFQVNGCFRHKHDCKYFKWPSSHSEFWRKKLEGNAIRDQRNLCLLGNQGIRTLVVWECALKGQPEEVVKKRIQQVVDWLISMSESTEIP